MSSMTNMQQNAAPALLNISQAAKLAGKHRSTIQRAIKRGDLSKSSDAQDNPLVNVAELERVYGPLRRDSSEQGSVRQNATPRNDNKSDALQLELELKDKYHEKRERELLEQIKDLKEERDRLLGVVEKSQENMRLLTHEQGRKAQKGQALSWRERLIGKVE